MRLNLGSVLTGVLMSVAGKLITALGVGFVSYAGLSLLQNKFAGWLQTQMGAIPADALQIFYIAGGGVVLNWLFAHSPLSAPLKLAAS